MVVLDVSTPASCSNEWANIRTPSSGFPSFLLGSHPVHGERVELDRERSQQLYLRLDGQLGPARGHQPVQGSQPRGQALLAGVDVVQVVGLHPQQCVRSSWSTRPRWNSTWMRRSGQRCSCPPLGVGTKGVALLDDRSGSTSRPWRGGEV